MIFFCVELAKGGRHCRTSSSFSRFMYSMCV